MLRQYFLQKLDSRLNSTSFFEAEDFTVKNEVGSSTNVLSKLTIQYRFDKRFSFVANVFSTKRGSDDYGSVMPANSIQCSFSPGPMTNQDAASVTGEDGLLSLVGEWMTLCQQELAATPIARQVAAQREQIEQLIEEAAEVPNTYFTKEEAAEVFLKLNELEEQLKSVITARDLDRAAMQKETDALHREFEALRTQVNALTKRNWLGAALVRMTKWAAEPENAKILKGGADIVKGWLPPPSP